MSSVALVTCAAHPRLYADDLVLARALEAKGVRAVPAVWDAAIPDGIDAWLIRSTWDYHLRAAEFLDWVRRASATRPLWNAPELIVWNAHKTYLRDLARRGVRTVPTLWARGGEVGGLAAELGARGWSDIVVKPAVSASAHRTARFGASEREAALHHATELAAAGTAMLQPYFASVEDYGERSFFYIDGVGTHGVQRQAVLTAGFEAERPAPLVEPTIAERALCEATLAALDHPPLYARVDVAPDDAGVPHLMELELIEPRLYFREAPHAADRLARAVAVELR